MTKIGYYPGCSLSGSAREYGESLNAIASELGIQLHEVPDWNCCGATAAHNMNHELALSLPARIIALAEREGLDEILVPCAACFNRLASAQHELNNDKTMKTRIAEIINMPYNGTITITNIVDFLHVTMEKLGDKIKNPFDHAVACYYGCLLVRPPRMVQFDRPEDPEIMDAVMKKIGAAPVPWSFKTECCGGGFSVSRTETVARLSAKVISDAVRRGAEAIIVACPMCHSNLDMRRKPINKYEKKNYSIPVLYITQAIGLAMGINEKKLGLSRHFVPVRLPHKTRAEALPETEHQGMEV